MGTDISPSGRLPITIPNIDNEMGMTSDQYPGVNQSVTTYSEKLNVGYRW
jgi:beta-glucosidase